jgi:glycine/D-amino acid oxidase-like deaminating enzyme
VDENVGEWRVAVRLRGGGRLDAKRFCEETRHRLGSGGGVREDKVVVHCEGAAGLIRGQLGEHRCAKGEILTVRIPSGDPGRILIGGGGWLVPVGSGLFKAGSTYEWERLDGEPSEQGRARVEAILSRLGIQDFEVVGHEAGIRPIVRRSMPLIGRTPDGSVVFNGLGSKGSLYAPGVARRLADWLVEGGEIEEDLDVGRWMGSR